MNTLFVCCKLYIEYIQLRRLLIFTMLTSKLINYSMMLYHLLFYQSNAILKHIARKNNLVGTSVQDQVGSILTNQQPGTLGGCQLWLCTVAIVYLFGVYCCYCLLACCILLLLFTCLLCTVAIVYWFVVYCCYCLLVCCVLLLLFTCLLCTVAIIYLFIVYCVAIIYLIVVYCCYCLLVCCVLLLFFTCLLFSVGRG